MKVLILSNGELKEKEIEGDLEEIQKIVGGYIEVPYISEVFRRNKIDIIINADGKFIEGLNKEIAVVNKATNRVIDFIMGSCIFASHDEKGNTTSLNDKQINIIKESLQSESVLYNPATDETFVVRVLFI